jgi:superfamily II DNA or RNA helicase
MKVLGRRGYVVRKETLKPDEILSIKKELTFTNGEEFSTFSKQPEEFPIYAENAAKLYLPRAYGLKRFGEPDSIQFTTPIYKVFEKDIKTPFTFNGSLRDYQEEAVAKTLERFQTSLSGGIISMPCGFGKTRTTINIIYRLKNEFVKAQKPFKCIIVVHKEFLANQWIENVRALIPEAKIGIIQADRVDVERKDVVLAMLQSISMKEYPDELFNQFDLAVFDECHHLAAQVFSRALLRVGCKYLLGLSATIYRKDFCHDVFLYSIGHLIYKIDRPVNDKALVQKIVINSNNDKYYKEEYNKYSGNKHMPSMINYLCEFSDRNELIVNVMRKILEHEEGRKIICLSSRRDEKHLGFIREITESKPIVKKDGSLATVGYYMGYKQSKGYSKKKHVASLEISAKCDIILATMDISKEGLDIPSLNTIIYATPITGLVQKMKGGKSIEEQTTIEQSIGRILREPPEQRKLIPIVIDILDNFSNYIRWGYTRNAFYKKVGYPMTRNVITLNKENEGNQKYNLDFLLDRSIFYAEDKDIREVTEGIIREDSSLSEETSRGECLLEDD